MTDGQLLVSFQARTDRYERDVARAGRRTSTEFRRMQRDAATAAAGVETSLTRMSTKLGGLGKAVAGGLVAGGAVAALEGMRQAANDSIKSILEVGDQAKRAGVSFRAFQELKFVAEQNRIGVDALTDGLKELSLRADEFVITGKGSAAEAFQRLGYDAEQLKEKLKQPDQLFLQIIGKLQKLDKAAQMRIADELFGGTGGEQFVQLIEKGEAGLRAQAQAARDLGIVMDEQMLAKAELVNQKFNMIATTIGVHVKSAIVNAVSAWSEFLDSYREFRDQRRGTLENRQAELGSRRLELETERSKIRNGEAGWLYSNPDGPLAKGRIHDIELDLAEIAAEERQIVEELNRRVKTMPQVAPAPPVSTLSTAPTTTTTQSSQGVDLTRFLAAGKDASHITGMSSSFEGKLEKMLEALPKELAGQITINSGFRSVERQAQLWQQALEKYGSVAEARKWVAPPGNSQHNKGNAADLGYGSDAARRWAHDNASRFGLSFPLGNENWHIEDADARADMMADKTRELEERGRAYDDITASAREFVAEQGREGQALGMTSTAAARLRYEQQMLNDAQRQGVELTPRQRQEIGALAQGMAEAEASVDGLRTKQEQAAEASRFFAQGATDALTGLISGAMTADQAMQSFLQSLIKVTLQGALMGEGPLAGLFGTTEGVGIFSAIGKVLGFAEGGHVRGPGSGTSDSIPAMLSNGEHVTRAAMVRKHGPLLDAINEDRLTPLYLAARGYVGTGRAGRLGEVRAVSAPASINQPISISAPITINGSSGTPEQNADLAERMAKQMEGTMRGIVVSEIFRQSRPGNALANKAR